MLYRFSRRTALSVTGLLLGACFAQGACAQQTTQNVTTQSSDAFGRSVGGARSGLYTTDEVRGFNPIDAGNGRIEGLYFDQLDRVPGRVLDSSTIRVGFAAQGFPFPAPTGLVDYALTLPRAERVISLEIETGAYFSPQVSLEWQIPLDGERVGISGGISRRSQTRPEGGHHENRVWGSAVVFRPSRDARFLAFAGGIQTRGEEARATIFPAGPLLPPRIERGRFLGQRWTQGNRDSTMMGAIADFPLGSFRIEGGLFRAEKRTRTSFADLLSGVATDGSAARRTIIADGHNRDSSLSGELRVVRQWHAGAFEHSVTATVRGRARDRLFGGSSRIDLGPSSAVLPDFRPRPGFTLGPENRDEVREVAGGLAYSVAWDHRLRVDAGVLKSRYRKDVDFANPLVLDAASRNSPWLWNASASMALTPRLTAYIASARGQEDALIAPDVAVNRSETPPAIGTTQYEGGLRFELPRVTVVASAFQISKPYFNIDSSSRYRQLGDVVNRGLELSLTSRPIPGLAIVGGVLLLDPRITGEAVEEGRIGPRPVGQVRRRAVLNVDWRVAGGRSPWSFDMAMEAVSSRMGNAQNTLAAPAVTNVDLGARYRFSLGGASWLLRLQVLNALDSYGWKVSPSGGFTYTNGRTALVGIVADL